MAEYTPAEIIKQAKAKANTALLHCCADEIIRICNAFTYDTGLAVSDVYFDFLTVTTLGGKSESVMQGVNIRHINP